MGVTYAQASDAATLEPVELGERLERLVWAAMPGLEAMSDDDAGYIDAATPTPTPTKWSAKQVIGHLTDSAINNLSRVVRMALASGQTFPGYEQDGWVATQHYAQRDWPDILDTWVVLNEQMAWTVKHLDKAALAHTGDVEGDPLTLGYLIEDYVAHMAHHLRALAGLPT